MNFLSFFKKHYVIMSLVIFLIFSGSAWAIFTLFYSQKVSTYKETCTQDSEVIRLKRELAKALKDATEKQKKLTAIEKQKADQKGQVEQLKKDLENAKHEALIFKEKLDQHKNNGNREGNGDYKLPEYKQENPFPAENSGSTLPYYQPCEQEEALDKEIADYEDFLDALDEVFDQEASPEQESQFSTGSVSENDRDSQDLRSYMKKHKSVYRTNLENGFDRYSGKDKSQKVAELQRKCNERTNKIMENQKNKSVDELKQALAGGLGRSLSDISK